jgi:hypothetical protein
MFCRSCGGKLQELSNFCQFCGVAILTDSSESFKKGINPTSNSVPNSSSTFDTSFNNKDILNLNQKYQYDLYKNIQKKYIQLFNPITGEIKEIKLGWSWTCFFFSSTFGIPLFLRDLNVWGALMTCISFSIIFLQLFKDYNLLLTTNLYYVIYLDLIILPLAIISFILTIWFAISANRLYAIKLFEKGWIIKDAEILINVNRKSWQISDYL